MLCKYFELCAQYKDCNIYQDPWLECYLYRWFESSLDREVFESRIRKKVFRGERCEWGYLTD